MNFSCNLLTTVLKVKKGMVVWAQNGYKCIDCWPSVPWLPESCLLLPCPASQESTVLHITSPGKGLHSILKVQFLMNAHCFYTTVKLKICQPNHHKSGTIYILARLLSSVSLENNTPDFSMLWSKLQLPIRAGLKSSLRALSKLVCDPSL